MESAFRQWLFGVPQEHEQQSADNDKNPCLPCTWKQRVVDTDLLGAFTQHLLQLPVKEDYPGKCFIQLKTFHTSWKGWDCCLFVSFFLVQFKPPCLSVHLLLTYLHRQFNSFVFYFVFCKPNKLVEKRLKRAAIIFSCFPGSVHLVPSLLEKHCW